LMRPCLCSPQTEISLEEVPLDLFVLPLFKQGTMNRR
jgi:hypothetical protein